MVKFNLGGGGGPKLGGGDGPKLGGNKGPKLDGAQQDAESLDPLGLEEMETRAKEELSETLAGFKDRAAKENARAQMATTDEFWFAVSFPSKEHRDEFMSSLGINDSSMCEGDQYVNGLEFARVLGIELTATLPQPRKLGRVDRDLRALALGNGRPVTKRHIDDDEGEGEG